MNLVDKVFRARIGIEDEGTLSVTGNTTLSSNVTISRGIIANGSIGNATDVLTSNGTGVYWASSNTKPDAAYSNAVTFASNATNLTTGTVPNARLGANVINTSSAFTITGIHTYSANIVTTANVNVTNGTALGILFANTTNAYFTGIALNANNAGFVGGNTAATLRSYSDTQAAAAYTNAVTIASNATNITTGTLPFTVIPANVVNTSAAFTITGVYTYAANVVIANGTANGILFANTTNAYFTGIALNANDSVTVGGNTAATLRTYSETQASNAYSTAVSAAASDATSKAATAYSNAVANSANATNLTTGTVPSGRLSGSYTGITAVGALSSANIGTIYFESTGNNRIQYDGSNTFSIFAGGVKVISGNSTVVQIESNNVILDNTTATIKVGYTITPYNIGTITSGTVTPAPANGNYQYYTNNGAHTLAAPTADCAIDILITNGTTAGAITFSGYTVGSTVGDALTTTNTNKFLISIRRINSISTYVIKALQ